MFVLFKRKKIEDPDIAGCRLGDISAQTAIYNKYSKSMYHCALRVLGDSMEAEDVMQESFITAFSKIKTFEIGGPFAGWLKRIVVNKSIDRLRRKRYYSDDLENVEIEDSEYEEMPLSVADIQEAMHDLPDRLRTIFSLHLFDGYKHEEIAEMMEMNHGAVRTAYHRAKAQMRHILSEKLVERDE